MAQARRRLRTVAVLVEAISPVPELIHLDPLLHGEVLVAVLVRGLHVGMVSDLEPGVAVQVRRALQVRACSPCAARTAQASLACAAAVATTVCALGDENCWSGRSPCVSIGELFNHGLAKRLAEAGADRFGENGEFHSLAEVWDAGHGNPLAAR